ncbi:putative phosphoribosyltransferase [Gillisia mitskevichiae]|uniref:Putative phosphoribosyltransferase n=1 Tax=Gillisia mitskevichiae TaxID=270921 RepID=A0A495PW65_9FLAO|nr:phosphoribosyltransferase family protein [Gillisia mitskevichiae]RKS53728.1 putative phosphoribosyltransferase [Gillisia mitskevichiae]
MRFKDRKEAGQILAIKLQKYKDDDAIVLAIPRGGVPLGYAIAKSLKLPLEVVLSKKIGHPLHKEYAIGAVTLKNRVLSDVTSHISSEYIEMETKRIREKLKKRFHEYYGNRKPLPLKGHTLIVVDDGIATGNTILSTIEMLFEEKPHKMIVAIPVASNNALQKLQHSQYIDEVVCLLVPENFRAVGQFYQDFEQVDDATVARLLNEANSSYTQ